MLIIEIRVMTGAEIRSLQALYEFGKAVQLSLFGGAVVVSPQKCRKL
jgi:hypothetical protein